MAYEQASTGGFFIDTPAQAPSGFEHWKAVHVRLHGCYSWQQLSDALAAHRDELDDEALALALDKAISFRKGSNQAAADGAELLGGAGSDGSASAAAAGQQTPQLSQAQQQRALLASLGSAYMRLLPHMDATLATRLLHSFATVGINPPGDAKGLLELCRHILEHRLPALKAVSPDHLINVLWAIGKLSNNERVLLEEAELGTRAVDPQLFSAAAGLLYPRVDSLQSRHLSKLAHAFSMAGIYYYPLLLVTVNAARVKIAEFNPASLSNLIKCLARLNFPEDAFYQVVAERMQLDMRKLKGHQVVSIVRAFAALKYENADFYEAASQRLQLAMSELTALAVTQTAWSYAVRNIQDIKLYNALAFRAGPIISKFSPSDLAMLSWSFARQGLHQRNLLEISAKESVRKMGGSTMKTMANESVRKMDGISMKNMANAAWAYVWRSPTSACTIAVSSQSRRI
ncbi:hypothetical protein FOA52_009379 [Chlamydomonas sp. UWO 241]|nr:hypothetical protein FOA52_009379 [Chlamydomonas sp. UWO 241]